MTMGVFICYKHRSNIYNTHMLYELVLRLGGIKFCNIRTYVHKDLILSVWGCIICQEVYICTYINACMYGHVLYVHTYILHICMYRCVHMYVRMYGRTTTHLFECTKSGNVLLEVIMEEVIQQWPRHTQRHLVFELVGEFSSWCGKAPLQNL